VKTRKGTRNSNFIWGGEGREREVWGEGEGYLKLTKKIKSHDRYVFSFFPFVRRTGKPLDGHPVGFHL
jgi:hypothetical protein